MSPTKCLFSLLFFVLLIAQSDAQVYEETIKETAAFAANSPKLISVHNIEGHVEIVGYNGSNAEIEVDQYIKAKSSRHLESGKSEVSLRIVETDEAIVVYVEQPNAHFNTKKRSYRWDNEHYQKKKYNYNFDIKIKVPYDTNIEATAMNDGDLTVTDIQTSTIEVSNLNGAIALKNVAGAINANALNEDIDVEYHTNPTEESWFNALNGDVNVTVPDDLDAFVHFKSLNGSFYSNMAATAAKPKLSKNVSRNKKRTKYSLSSDGKFEVGAGGPDLHFDLLNGDVNLMK